MKSIVRLALAFALGIFVTVTVIIPKLGANPEPAETAQTPEIQAEVMAAVTETIEAVPLKAEIAEVQEEPEVIVIADVSEPKEIAKVIEPEPASTPEPAKEPVKAQQSSPPQPTFGPQTKKAEPEYFYEDGKKYAYINGHKTYIAGDDEPAVNQIEAYDWENDPIGQIKGPFN